MKKTGGLVHGMAFCETCKWEAKHWRNAQACAAVHAMKHKHLVVAEVGMSYTYDGRD